MYVRGHVWWEGVHAGWGCAWQRGVNGRGMHGVGACMAGGAWQGDMYGGGTCVAGGRACMAGGVCCRGLCMATAVGGMHPTGMHSCLQ